ncbi:adhesin [Methanosphaera sp. BMS]|uniref:adhesin n=1 Tax=Methanosphaera sp. BMS TaxID=1789762 RepID=UPI000DC1C73D|nr:adhesin [Methanosphaera sp. BMS]AWX31734.1 hypothetical protein AW729_00925 [Methanosphaera sp. BMS]
MTKTDYPSGPTTKAKVNSREYNAELLGENKLGSVHIHGPYGNNNSKIKIACLIGMHPYESKSHRAFFETIHSKDESLNYKYYIYNINVTKEDTNDEGRMDGQLLAQEYVANHIINGGYDFFVDVHSNKGTRGPGKYEITNFIFAPGFDTKSEHYIQKILSTWSDIEYYAPEYRTSPSYITEPTSASGIATIVYETYSYEDMQKTLDNAERLIEIIDTLDFTLAIED